MGINNRSLVSRNPIDTGKSFLFFFFFFFFFFSENHKNDVHKDKIRNVKIDRHGPKVNGVYGKSALLDKHIISNLTHSTLLQQTLSRRHIDIFFFFFFFFSSSFFFFFFFFIYS